MLDPSRLSDSSKTYDELCRTLQESLNQKKSHGRSSSRAPPRHKSTPTSSSSATPKPTNRRNSNRNLRLASTRALQLDDGINDSSDSSLNMSGLSLDPFHETKYGSNRTMNTSRGSLDSSASSIPADPTHISQTTMSASPRRSQSTDRSPSGNVRRSTSRISDLRREMSQKALQRGNDSKTLAEDDHTVQTNPQIVLQKSLSPRRRSKKPAFNKRNTDSSNKSAPINDGKFVETTWKRNPGSSLKESSDAQPNRLRQHLDSEKKVVGGSMRNILRNKRQLEKELHSNDIFHFVLHKARPSSKIGQGQKRRAAKRAEKEVEEKESGNEPADRMPLDRFLLMKQKSEQLVMENDINSREQMEENGTWRRASIEFSRSASASNLLSVANTEMTEMNDGEDNEQGLADDDESVVSLNVYGSLINNAEAKESQALSHESGATAMSEEMESQTLSLNLDDIQLQEDEKSARDSEHTLGNVTDFAVVDPAGRKGVYSGSISRSSGMPCGQGRLEYVEEGEIFEGQFVHGYWTGYGRCIYNQTGEDYTGTFLDSVRHGHGICKYQDGRVFEGTYTNGVKTEGKMTYQDGSTYLGHWYNGARHGRGTYTFANGSVFIGEFQDDRMHGSGVLTWSNGRRYVGSWKHGIRHGPGQEFRPNGTIRREGEWKEGAFVKG